MIIRVIDVSEAFGEPGAFVVWHDRRPVGGKGDFLTDLNNNQYWTSIEAFADGCFPDHIVERVRELMSLRSPRAFAQITTRRTLSHGQ
jgi:hypothetical protein